jgi:autotransporter-associated beta strand protein
MRVIGAQPLTITGNVDLAGNAAVVISNTTTFSGSMSRGGLAKEGAGTLILSGNNTFEGALISGDGATPGMLVLRSNNSTGSTRGFTAANPNSTVALTNNVVIPDGELMLILGDGVGAQGALRSLGGNTTWGGDVGGAALASNTIGADSGVMTIKGSLFTEDILDDPNTDPPPSLEIPMTKTGAGQINVGSSVFQDVNSGPDFNGAIVTNQGALTVLQGTLRVTPAPTPNTVVSIVGSVNIDGGPATPTAKLDLTNTTMRVEYGTNPSPLDSIRQLIGAGYNGGDWAGNGITSSTAATSPNAFGPEAEDGATALGYAELSQIPSGLPSDTAILIKYTYFGDSDLNGVVDVADLGNLATAWQSTGTWVNGDFDYNGTINVNDLGLLATNWQDGTVNPLGPSLAEALAQLGLPNVAVPEPTALGAFAAAGLALGRRRRVW